MNVKILDHTPLWVCAQAIRDCYDSHHLSDTTEEMREGVFIDDSLVEYSRDDGYRSIPNGLDDLIISKTEECGEKDKALIHKVGVQNHHASTLEHLVYTFDIDGISRACLQELARHRIASYSVKSTRYTLRELKKEESFIDGYVHKNIKRASKYVVLTDEPEVNQYIVESLDRLRYLTTTTIKNDKIKYALPEAYKTSLTWTINARALINFLSLRTSSKALWEIQKLAEAVFEELPDEHKYLFEGFITGVNSETRK
jgi:thymidylate synthase (FAD)